MTASLLVLVFGAFFAGGAISFRQQGKPRWSVVVLAVIALALLGYGGYSWIRSV